MELNELGITAIPGASPAGADVRSEEIFDKLSTEIEKMSSPSAAGAIDWERVKTICADILSANSKDLLVAGYLSVALLKTDGLAGLRTGVHIWRDMLSTYWDSLFPAKSRMRGRRNAVDWWVEKISSTIKDLKPEQWKKEDIDSLYADLDAIDTFLRNNMEEAPAVGPLMSIIGSVLAPVEEKPSPEAAPKAPEPKQPAAPSAAARPAVDPGPVPAGDDPEPLIRHALETLRAAAALLVENNNGDGLYFRINRTMAWMTVTAPPPSHGGRTMIESPDEEVRDSIKSMHRSGSWKNLLSACESRVTQFLFWLDLSRYAAEALQNLGMKAASAEVTGLTVLYVKRLPGIERLTFADGTPFADPDTKRWLTEADSAPAQGDPDGLLKQVEDDTGKARAMAQAGNLPAGVASLRDALTRSPSVRERFLRQVHLCRFLSENDQARVSGSYFRELVTLMDVYRLGEWEPALAAEACEVILAGARGQGLEDLTPDAFRRLSLLDPVKAMEYA